MVYSLFVKTKQLIKTIHGPAFIFKFLLFLLQQNVGLFFTYSADGRTDEL